MPGVGAPAGVLSGAPPLGAPPGAPPGAPGAKAPSALDAPLTEAQIATLPPALQAVLRKKQAEQGISPAPPAPPGAAPPGAAPPGAAPPGAALGLTPEPVAPAAEELTAEQRTVLAQLRSLYAQVRISNSHVLRFVAWLFAAWHNAGAQQEEREKREAEEKAQKQQAEQARGWLHQSHLNCQNLCDRQLLQRRLTRISGFSGWLASSIDSARAVKTLCSACPTPRFGTLYQTRVKFPRGSAIKKKPTTLFALITGCLVNQRSCQGGKWLR